MIQFCENHWKRIREEVRVRGLAHLVPADATDMFNRAVSEQVEKPHAKNFDPLRAITFNIYSASLEMLGIIEGCPICKVMEWCGCGKPTCTPQSREKSWIEGPVNMAVKEAKSLGIIPGKPVSRAAALWRDG